MPTSSESLSYAGYIETIPTRSEAQFSLSPSRFFYQESEIGPLYRGEYLVYELRSELALGYMIALEDILRNHSSDDQSSLERYKVLEYMSVEL